MENLDRYLRSQISECVKLQKDILRVMMLTACPESEAIRLISIVSIGAEGLTISGSSVRARTIELLQMGSIVFSDGWKCKPITVPNQIDLFIDDWITNQETHTHQ